MATSSPDKSPRSTEQAGDDEVAEECALGGGGASRVGEQRDHHAHQPLGGACDPGGWVADTLLQSGSNVVSFGEDFAGELYVLNGNQISRIDSDAPAVPALGLRGALLLLFALSCLSLFCVRRVRRGARQRVRAA